MKFSTSCSVQYLKIWRFGVIGESEVGEGGKCGDSDTFNGRKDSQTDIMLDGRMDV